MLFITVNLPVSREIRVYVLTCHILSVKHSTTYKTVYNLLSPDDSIKDINKSKAYSYDENQHHMLTLLTTRFD